ncbi:MAG: aminomethyl-transferring glycine dehydrogenase subunit GcvPB [Candidatus Hodarchaeales archaeon]|jgi:glycine dehydrogenase subunit 2
MMKIRQANWNEPLISEMSSPGRIGYALENLSEEEQNALRKALTLVPKELIRKKAPQLPELTELEVVRHYTRLSQMNFGVDCGFYPLGSCTMKYNPRINESIAVMPKLSQIHPEQDPDTVQGALALMYQLERWLSSICGMEEFTLQPAAGAHGEFTGIMIIRAFHEQNNELQQRTQVIVPDTAHGTNPATAAMCGFEVVVVPSGKDGCLEIEALKEAVSAKTAGLMLTNPNTLGLFEKEICEIAGIVHEVGGLLYYDGANLNAVLGKVRPGDMGFDVVHVNLHKSFSTPHGGGGPGAGPVGVAKELAQFLPIPIIVFDGTKYSLNYNRPHSIGKVRTYFGNFGVLARAYAYIYMLGVEGLTRAAELAVLNANYLKKRISEIDGFSVPFGEISPHKHEFVASSDSLKRNKAISASMVSKYLLENMVHPPTVYFPLIVPEALMIEPTETESKQSLDEFAEILSRLSSSDPESLPETLPTGFTTAIDKVDEKEAARRPILSFKMIRNQNQKK